jgi:mRNA degradation ribonuclease J1/J2
MSLNPSLTTPADDELLYLPLGGTGEIGMNLNLYGHAGHWLIIDIGITFGGDAFPGLRRADGRPGLHRQPPPAPPASC